VYHAQKTLKQITIFLVAWCRYRLCLL